MTVLESDPRVSPWNEYKYQNQEVECQTLRVLAERLVSRGVPLTLQLSSNVVNNNEYLSYSKLVAECRH
ncbi:hypothetical protein PoB_006340400 [Plakobranchus ocellatus]|uniref:Uncharacterized protein n=1 Tax=Plakobranchus ocellatus TaxID=259542 RepID=A0AAV4CY94_9GAST|nr:hypothetical protein PoB_006340400 [Plakobranchus ocellatus]